MWFETAQGILTLIATGIALISATITVSIKLYNAGKVIIKDKNWKKIMVIAMKAMEAAEKTGASGADKKAQVIEAVKAGCIEAGIDVSQYLDDLSKYIDECIDFANSINKAAKTK